MLPPPRINIPGPPDLGPSRIPPGLIEAMEAARPEQVVSRAVGEVSRKLDLIRRDKLTRRAAICQMASIPISLAALAVSIWTVLR